MERSELVAFLQSLTSPAVAKLAERAALAEVGNPAESAP